MAGMEEEGIRCKIVIVWLFRLVAPTLLIYFVWPTDYFSDKIMNNEKRSSLRHLQTFLSIKSCGRKLLGIELSKPAKLSMCSEVWDSASPSRGPSRVLAPRSPSREMLSELGMFGAAELSSHYYNDSAAESPFYLLATLLDQFAEAARQAKWDVFPYPEAELLWEAIGDVEVGGRGLVVGTEVPWAEAFALAHGAASLTVLDYRQRQSSDARLRVARPWEMGQLLATDGRWDFALSFSSLEHSGLGRYGEPLHPWADLHEMKRLRCAVKEGGLLLVAVPTGREAVVWNGGREYSALRWALLATGLLPLRFYSLPERNIVDLADHAGRVAAEDAHALLTHHVLGVFENRLPC